MLAETGKRITGTRRRGVILVVILGMLGLLALIGVTFASFSGQSRVSAVNFSQAQKFPDGAELMDFALSQLIDDTNNPQSVIRGHSLKRDMYGYDAIYNGALLNGLPDGSGNGITITNVTQGTGQYAGLLVCQTNFPTNAFYSYNYPNNYFSRWIIRFPGTLVGTVWRVGQSHEIIIDDNTDSSGFRVFYVPEDDSVQPSITGYVSPENNNVTSSQLVQANAANFLTGVPFQLDGRFQRAFNGSGMGGAAQDSNGNSHPLFDAAGHPFSEYANFRYNGHVISSALNSNHNPDFTPGISPYYLDPNLYSDTANNVYIPIGMDEDYDAPDLENWFLAIQSADGRVAIPSFHRPGILTALDWFNVYDSTLNVNDPAMLATTRSMSRILRPRSVDGHSSASFPPLLPTGGSITYDVDNDGDSLNESVWLDLGYPPQTNSDGQVFKPMFSFLVIGLNGKLPLNSAGNLQATMTSGQPTFTQATSLGYSPSEIDITFALQNAYDPNSPISPYSYNTAGSDYSSIYLQSAPYMQIDDAGFNRANPSMSDAANGIDVRTTQLRNLLAGSRLPDPNYKPNDPTTTPSTNLDINAVMMNGNAVLMPNGIFDTNDYTGLDNNGNTAVPSLTSAVAGRWGEEWGVPQYLYGTGTSNSPYQNPVRAGLSFFNGMNYDVRDDNHNTFDFWPALAAGTSHPENADYYDVTGSLLFPVERIRRFVTPLDLAGTGRVRTYGAESTRSTGGDAMGRVAFFGFFRPPGLLIDITPQTAVTPAANQLATWNSQSNASNAPANSAETIGMATVNTIPANNRLRGYEAFRNPNVTGALGGGAPKGLYVAGMPSDGMGNLTVGETATPTFDVAVNSNPGYPSRGLNEADEMTLYGSSQYDRAFGPSDLQWLYRFQDVDGQSLQSRLSYLAPISFTNPLDGPRRRRLFALDAFETNNFAWSNNSMAKLQANGATNAFTPPIAHRDRKINLNFPLPVSNSPDEPVRQKWIRESYALLKLTLPPTAVDTPEELAQLSQYLINVVDFRDPDATSTKFINTDITVTPATISAAPKLTRVTNGATGNLVQHGMEYSPIAINEVLAYQFETKVTDKQPSAVVPQSKRMFFEVVNTLTQDATAIGGVTGISNDLDLTGWDVVVMPDNGYGRPDPYTGQIPTGTTGGPTITSFPLVGGTQASPAPFVQAQNIPALPSATVNTTTLLPRGSDNKDYYFVFGNNQISGTPLTVANGVVNKLSPPAQPGGTGGQTVETGWPNATVNGTSTPNIVPNAINLDLTSQLTTPNTYYWLYLRRPSNPFDTGNTDPDGRIVVDSFRFMFTYSQGRGTYNQQTMKDEVNPPNLASIDFIYSLQRMQPYRGGHAITPLPGDATGAPANYVMTSYGFSEQTFPAGNTGTGANVFGQYGTLNVTGPILNTLGQPNKNASVTNDSVWEYVPFNDRDFANPIEMTLVPAVAPGLFTKQFIENPPPINFTTTPLYPNTVSAGTAIPANAPTQFTPTSAPRTFPYLSDKFFYTGQVEPTGGYPAPASGPAQTSSNGHYVGGPSGAGWHSMLEFFEVPSPVFGSIGSVENGTNYDWARQDTKPGLLNPNLIIDEEVFLGLMGNRFYSEMNKTAPGGATLPRVVLQVDTNGTPSSSVPFSSTGFIDSSQTPMNHLKGAFADFLNLRHGGSGFLYGFGNGATGSTAPLAVERPYRSLTYRDVHGNYDINATIMRPATLPPSANTTPVANPAIGAALPTTQPTPFVADPGVKNPYLFANNNPIQPPPIPTRRLFQVPDNYGAPNNGATLPAGSNPSNASPTGDPNVNTPITLSSLTNPDADLISEPLSGSTSTTTNYIGGLSQAADPTATPPTTAVNDNRDHPYFRSEWLQRVANLTTPRTHQYAVWITVGFFEVTQQGDPSLALTNPLLAYDILGLELGVIDGKNTRYRGFFLLDRTRAVGFNPANPGDFRDVVVYRQMIED